MAAAKALLPLLLVLISQPRAGAILWYRSLQSELFSRSFGGFQLCAANASLSVNITGVDQYTVPSTSPSLFYNLRSQYTTYVLGCSLPPLPDGLFFYVKTFLVSSVQWGDVCANTRNLTMLVTSSTGSPDTNFSVQPCNYSTLQAGLSVQQLTAWILLTYSADWTPDWVNRTAGYPEGGDAATVIVRSETNQQANFTWRNFLAYDLRSSLMTPSQKALAVLASVRTSRDWWLYICGVANSSGNLLFSVRNQSKGSETSDFYLNCKTRTSLELGAPSPSGLDESTGSARPTIESRSGGYWGRHLQRQLTMQTFGELAFCAANTTGNKSAILVSTTDDIVVPGGSTIARGTFEIQLSPCQENISAALGDAHLKVFLRSAANWSDVCANSINPIVRVNLLDRTAVQFRPCPAENDSALVDPNAAAAKLAWCLFALNTSDRDLEWSNRDTSSLVVPSAASVSFRILGDTNASALTWGNVIVNGLTAGDQVDRLVRVFQGVDTAYWPVICQLINSTLSNASADIYLGIRVSNGSKSANMYTNCSTSSELTLLTTPAPTTTPTTSTRTTKTTPTTTTTPAQRGATGTPSTPATTTTPAQTGTTGTPTLSPKERQAITDKANLAQINAGKQRDELATQVAVVVAALSVLVVLSTFGLVKMVLPRTA